MSVIARSPSKTVMLGAEHWMFVKEKQKVTGGSGWKAYILVTGANTFALVVLEFLIVPLPTH